MTTLFSFAAVDIVVPLLVLVAFWQGIGFQAMYFHSYLQTIDPSLYEAARLDGASGRKMPWPLTGSSQEMRISQGISGLCPNLQPSIILFPAAPGRTPFFSRGKTFLCRALSPSPRETGTPGERPSFSEKSCSAGETCSQAVSSNRR